jgi:hypothetical protein
MRHILASKPLATAVGKSFRTSSSWYGLLHGLTYVVDEDIRAEILLRLMFLTDSVHVGCCQPVLVNERLKGKEVVPLALQLSYFTEHFILMNMHASGHKSP